MALLYFLRTDAIRKAQLATGVGLVSKIMIRCQETGCAISLQGFTLMPAAKKLHNCK
jgi:hypothetical protein